MSGRTESRIYVGNLPPDIRSRDIEDLFYKYGKINRVDLKNKRGPPFAFIEFEHYRDAEYAVEKRDGYDYDGYKLRVEFPKLGGYDRNGGAAGYRHDRGGFSGRRGGGRFQDARRNYRRTNYRVQVSGLPVSGSWQDLKDFMREAGEVAFSDVYRDGTGVVEFLKYDDMKYAVKNLDDTKFRSHEGETSYVRVREEKRSTTRSNSRSKTRSNSRSKSRSNSRSKSRSNSRSKSPSNSRSKSPSKSRTRSQSPRSGKANGGLDAGNRARSRTNSKSE